MADAPTAEPTAPPALDNIASSSNAVPSVSTLPLTATSPQAGMKRKASACDELESDLEAGSPTASTNGEEDDHATEAGDSAAVVSKRQMKRLKRKQAWEEAKEDRKARRREKRHNRQARKRAEKEHDATIARDAGADSSEARPSKPPSVPVRSRPVPITFMVDCDFEEYMHDNEIVSLSTQITRSYSENRKAPFRAHLVITSFGGKLRERFETSMGGHHGKWQGIHFTDGDFLHAARDARQQMSKIRWPAGKIEDLLGGKKETPNGDHLQIGRDAEDGKPVPEPQPNAEQHVEQRDIVYLTSDSPHTLSSLESNTIYVIGGIVDRNREKGLCYRRAKDRNVRTAKLPIGEFMAMSSRHVLTTNQVVEIMSQFLVEGDWGKAFVKVIPQRKGGTLKATGQNKTSPTGGDGGEQGGDDVDEGVVGQDDEQNKATNQDAVDSQMGTLGSQDATADSSARE